MALRSKDIFDLDEVQFAIVETTGSVSVMKKPSADTPTRADMRIKAEENDPPVLIISDGDFVEKALSASGLSRSAVETVLKSRGMTVEEVFIMTADAAGKCFIADRKGRPPHIFTIGGDNSDKN